MKVSTEIDNNFGYEKNYAAGRQYPFKMFHYSIKTFKLHTDYCVMRHDSTNDLTWYK
jgi:hypothetical protein